MQKIQAARLPRREFPSRDRVMRSKISNLPYFSLAARLPTCQTPSFYLFSRVLQRARRSVSRVAIFVFDRLFIKISLPLWCIDPQNIFVARCCASQIDPCAMGSRREWRRRRWGELELISLCALESDLGI